MRGNQVAAFDQNTTQFIDLVPPVWWRLFVACQEQGFTPEQAYGLVQIYVERTVAPIMHARVEE